MTWARVDDNFHRHPKAVAAGKDARAMYIASLCYANAALTDGKLPAEVLRIIAADAGVSWAATARKLVEVGLWIKVDGGYEIHDFLDYNDTRETVTRRRAEGKQRQRRSRASRGDIARMSQGDSARSSGVPSPAHPMLIASSSSTTEPNVTTDDSLVEEVLRIAVNQKCAEAAGSIRNAARWKAAVLADLRSKWSSDIVGWFERYDVTTSQAANAVIGGGVPASWGPYQRRPDDVT